MLSEHNLPSSLVVLPVFLAMPLFSQSTLAVVETKAGKLDFLRKV